MWFLDEKFDIAVCQGDTLFVFQIARWVVRILQFAVPFALIIWGSLDFFKAVIAGDEKEMKAKRKPFAQRVIAAVIVLVLPTIVNVIIANIKGEDNSFVTCWQDADPSKGINKPESNIDDGF